MDVVFLFSYLNQSLRKHRTNIRIFCLAKKNSCSFKTIGQNMLFKIVCTAKHILILIFRKTPDATDLTSGWCFVCLLYHIFGSLDGQGYTKYVKIRKEKYSNDILISRSHRVRVYPISDALPKIMPKIKHTIKAKTAFWFITEDEKYSVWMSPFKV